MEAAQLHVLLRAKITVDARGRLIIPSKRDWEAVEQPLTPSLSCYAEPSGPR